MIEVPRQAWFVASSAGLVLFCLGADHVIFRWEDKWMRLRHGAALRAVSDSLVHGLIGGWTWANVLLLGEGGGAGEGVTWTTRVLQVVLCVGMATAIDLDHMIEARSFSIKDALNLPSRPFAHNTTLIPVICLLLYLLVYFSPRSHPLVSTLPLMFLISTLSHHLRDADRRGIWFAPFFSTPPIPLKLYTLSIVLLPLATAAPRLLPLAFKSIINIRALGRRTEHDISMA